MKRIPLSATKPKGRPPRAYALVDDSDYDALVAFGPWQIRAGYYASHTNVYMHRLLLDLGPGDPRQADHIDGNGLNNQRSNLRVVDRLVQAHNRRSVRGSSSSFRGVSRRRTKWFAYATLDGIQHHLGVFTDEIDAAIAAQAFRDEHMAFARPDPVLLAALEGRAA